MKKLSLIFISLLFLLLTPINIALAEDSTGSNSGSGDATKQIEQERIQLRQNLENRNKEIKERLASKSAELKEKLDDVKEKICEHRKQNITNRADNVASRIEKHFDRFGELVTKVDTFYTTKLVPKGVVVTNYQDLKNDIATQKASVQALINTLKSDIASFNCASDNPKSQLETVKADIKDVHEAMKDYRTAIKNFIQAIKTAVGEKKNSTTSADKELD